MKRKTDNFNKFFNKKRNSAVKEEFRQEKKAAKKERKEAIERHFEEKRKAKGLPATNSESAPPAKKFAPAREQRGPIRGKSSGSGKPAAVPPKPVPATKKPAPASPIQKFVPTSRKPAGKPAPIAGKPDPESSGKPGSSTKYVPPAGKPAAKPDPRGATEASDLIPLNKYIAHGGICSRRDAAELIRQGKVLLNGKPVTEPGTRVSPSDQVKVSGKLVTMSRNFVYILLNKPKDYITTTDDPQGRKTVLDLVRAATRERVYPIGRLDRNTSGVLLLTNDGDLSQKLSHPKHEIKKIYHAVLDKPLTKADFDKIVAGVTLEDGSAHVDVLAYADPKDKTQIGLEIHSGRNRIVRRIFEHLGYDVRGLDRVMYAGLTKKNVQRGMWRLLNDKEIRILKYLNSSIKGSAKPAPPQNKSQAKEYGGD
ncbi:MAG TPA: pseudouridine synthase [Puia sp.]|nr:pseudouridine synthase [Puia sp.]